MQKIFIGYYNKANIITILGLLCALTSCFFALNNNLRLSVIFLICAGICDLFDGAIARKIKRNNNEKAFGIQLDTVVDVVSFCITPPVIVYSQASQAFQASQASQAGTPWYALLIYAFYIVCGVIRLAYFNTFADTDAPVKYYQGLPVTYISLILPIVLLFSSSVAAITAIGITGALFIINIRIPKPRGIWYILFPLIAIGLVILWCFL